MAGQNYRVFVSHGWADRWVARQMAMRMQQDAGAECFIDVFDIAKGDDIVRRIQTELPLCQELVALLTPWSTQRNWVWTEIGAAWVQSKRVIGVLYGLSLAELEQDKGGSACLRSTNIADINEFDDYIQELKQRVADHGNR